MRGVLAGGMLISALSVLPPAAIGTHPVGIAESRPAPAASIVATSRPTPTKSQPLLREQTTQLRLQIRQLRQETGRWASVRAWLPGGTAVVALIAALWGVATYLTDAKRDRRLRLEDKVEENIGILFEFPTDSSAGIGKIHNALRNLHALVQVERKRARTALEQRVTHAIVELVSYDLDLTDVRQARFDALALDQWNAYPRLLREDGTVRKDVIYRYQVALRTLTGDGDRGYETARLENGEYNFDPPIEDSELQRFATLVANYRRHLKFVSDDERREGIAAFEAVTANSELTSDVFSDTSAGASI